MPKGKPYNMAGHGGYKRPGASPSGGKMFSSSSAGAALVKSIRIKNSVGRLR